MKGVTKGVSAKENVGVSSEETKCKGSNTHVLFFKRLTKFFVLNYKRAPYPTWRLL